MRYRTPEAFRAALDQRLKNEAASPAASPALLGHAVCGAGDRGRARAGTRRWPRGGRQLPEPDPLGGCGASLESGTRTLGRW